MGAGAGPGSPERRAALVDAGGEVLAREGVRGLAFRAVNTQAGVPAGTASDYLTDRDDPLRPAATRCDRPTLSRTSRSPTHSRRTTPDGAGYLALLEDAPAHHPPPRAPNCGPSAKSVRGDLEYGMEFHPEATLPGGDETVTVLCLAMLGLILEHLPLPGVLDGVLPKVCVPEGLVGLMGLVELVERIVESVVPESPNANGPAARATSATCAGRPAGRGGGR
ncbi:TetR/AcrR family transcriptional regulator [Streptomyces sp. NPDC050619]|uniref:TetR/AcrR family transcriptional regulator n=1 Tax=Streptomyces sp. NPDC050619 TaxID=3157214 RepID=UPI00342DA34C